MIRNIQKNNSHNMRIFITHIAPSRYAHELGISMAATNFSYNLARGVRFDKVYSVLPPFITQGNSSTFSDDVIETRFSFLRKTLLSRIAAVFEQFVLLRKIPNGSNVWLYNVSPLNAYLIKSLRLLKPSVKIFPIILDYTPGDHKSEKWFTLINNCDGRIMLSTSDIFDKTNSAVLPGIVPENTESIDKVIQLTYDFLISGQLSDNISMLSTLLDIFAKIPDARLHITGNAPAKAKIYSEKYSNIICHGNLSYDRFLKVLKQCPFLLSTRDPEMLENQCNFPSKIIEGLLHNRIIVSTIDYPQLKNIKYLKVDAKNLKESIKSIMKLSTTELIKYSNQSQRAVDLYNPKVWDNIMTNIESKAQ